MENSTKYWANLVRENRKTLKILLYLIFGIILLIIVSIFILANNGYLFSISKTEIQQKVPDSVMQRPEDITMEAKE